MPRNRYRVAAALCAAAVAGGGAGAAAVALTHDSPSDSSPSVAAPATGVATVSNSSALTVGQIYKRYAAGVVEIDSTLASTQNGFGGPSSGSSAEGTGFVYDTNGDILTNEHVVDGATSVSVKFADGSTYKATVVGSDASTDVAVVHVDAPASKLTVLTLADSSTVAVGDGVVAIGNPFGLDNTVTTGIVSAVGREITAPDNSPIEGAIQTDAAINHGNSGGPLFDLAGKVIGITAQIQSDSGGNDGVGFAVDSNTVKSIATQLIATGKAQHALMGVSVQTATAGAGVKVGTVSSGSGADDAGVEAGDVITSVDGAATTTAQKLRAIIAAHKPGDTITVTLQRSGAKKTLKVTLGTRS